LILDLRNNSYSLPNTIGHLIKQRQCVYVPAHAPQIPNELFQKESWHIYHYLNGMLNQEKRLLNEAKLILVGEGAVGKTSLVNRLISEQYNEQEIKTEGINRQIWRLPLNEITHLGENIKEIIRVNVWDFGGQEIMHATHQFFLTKRSVYLLVLDARRGEQESRLEYWLKLIHSFGGDSPIIVVINKSDEHSLDINKRFLQSKYPNIKAFCNISCKTASGIPELKQIITEHIAANPDVKTALPKTWFELKGKLESLSENYIDYAEYEKLCKSQQITEKDSQKTLIGLLHDLGIVLNFQNDDRFDRLKETNVLNPAWVTEGVYKILNNIQLFQQKGKISLTDLSNILDKQNYPTRKEHQFIMDMMQKFELCFPFEDHQTYLIPELLQKEEPDINWNEQDSLAFQYHYDILPPSVISRFIVRMHEYISKQTYWRTGVVLQYENNKALIRADIEDKKIFIFVIGSQATRRVLLGIIRRDFDHIHKTIKGLDAKECVSLPQKPEVVIEYKHLLKLEEKGITEYYYPQIDDFINVPELLAGVDTIQKQPQPKVHIENITIHGGNTQLADIIENRGQNYEN
jgi:internalin A